MSVAIDSNLLVGSDTLHATKGPCVLDRCGGCGLFHKELHDANSVSTFPEALFIHSSIPISDEASHRASAPATPHLARSRDALGRKPGFTDKIRRFEALFAP